MLTSTTLLLMPFAVMLVLVAVLVYYFLIRIYLVAKRYKRMDPTLKTFITPFTGLVGLQK